MKSPQIRPIAICLFSNGDRILVSEAIDRVKGDRFCRPLGGGIDYGELSHAAIQREIQEEVGAEIKNLCLISVIENIFVYEDKPGHEIVFVYDAEFVDRTLYQQSALHCCESNHQSFVARWRSLADIQANQVRLVPPELTTLLQQQLNSH
jgi:8-oxo-dGTP pyrophosphatase MutT (NUDIX family)